MSYQVIVVATKKRPALILPYLNGIEHTVHWTTDYWLDEGWKPNPNYATMIQNQVGHLRCFRGHQDALALLDDRHDAALILEDDAVPNRMDWQEIAKTAYDLTNQSELVSLHGRTFNPDAFEGHPCYTGGSVLYPKPGGGVWVQGSLAYMIRRDAIPKFRSYVYDGYPTDIFICNEFKFALVHPSPFDHNRTAGSLIDCATPVKPAT